MIHTSENLSEDTEEIQTAARNKFQGMLAMKCIPDYDLKSHEEQNMLALDWMLKYGEKVSDLIDHTEMNESKKIRSLILEGKYAEAVAFAQPYFIENIEHADAA